MSKGNRIITSWSWASVYVAAIFVGGGVFASRLGIRLTWGEIVLIPFILTFFLNHQWHYCFTDSGFTVQYMVYKRFVSASMVKQINVFEVKTGTWIVVVLDGAPEINSGANCKDILFYYLRNLRKSFLIQLQWGEREKVLYLLKQCYPQIEMIS